MPETFDTWASYFYPETYDGATGQGTLRNLFDERDAVLLQELEFGASSIRQQEVRDGIVDIPRTFDAEHWKRLHKYVLQDVYAWAGSYRTVDMSKGSVPGGFADVGSGAIDRYLADVHRMVTGTQWSRLDRAGFVDASSRVFSWLNQAHPGREGNGRTAKLFMEHVAEASAFRFEWGRVTPQEWNQASMYSGPDLGAYEPHPEELREVFAAITVERSAAPRRDEDAWRAVDLARTQYPAPGHGLGGSNPAGPQASSDSTMPRAGYHERGEAER
ncbi:Fic/DOC family protein [Leifsonia shinshuensis]